MPRVPSPHARGCCLVSSAESDLNLSPVQFNATTQAKIIFMIVFTTPTTEQLAPRQVFFQQLLSLPVEYSLDFGASTAWKLEDQGAWAFGRPSKRNSPRKPSRLPTGLLV